MTFLIVSLLTHATFLTKMPSLNLTSRKDTFQKIEVTYKKNTPKPIENKIKISPKPKVEPAKKKVAFLKKPKPPQFDDYIAKLKPRQELIKKPSVYEHRSIIAGIRKVSLPEIKAQFTSDKAGLPKNPVYLRYYRAIREKIRRYAYYNYNRAYSGEIYLSFVVASDGRLKALRIIDEKSSPNNYLKEIATKSIKDASPYPVIPEELDYPELSFKVIIVFELD